MSERSVTFKSPVPGNFLGLLTIVFITLKLTDVIDWSWWLVLLPLWGGAALLAIFLILAGAMWAVALIVVALIDRNTYRKAKLRRTPLGTPRRL